MQWTQQLLLPATCAFFVMGVSARAEDPAVISSALESFVEQHCYDCHGAGSAEGGLKIDALSRQLGDGEAMNRWIKIFDKVSSGEMPPADAMQPKGKETQKFTQELNQTLHAVSLARQQREGRVVLRRLNRNEYETTLRDLLGEQVEVKALLPDDGIAAGFDNVSVALDISSVHLLRYQEAAESAIRTVIPVRKVGKTTARYSGLEITENVRTFKNYMNKSLRLDGDKLVLYAKTYDSVPCRTPRVSAPGRYRVRFAVSTVGTSGRPLPVMITTHTQGAAEDRDARRLHDIPAGKKVVLTEEFYLTGRSVAIINPWDLPGPRQLEKVEGVLPLAQYSGPGLVIEWAEIEGPIDEFPLPGFRRLFGDVRVEPKNPNRPEWVHVVCDNPRNAADRAIRAALPTIFRRPVDEALADYFVHIAHQRIDEGEPFVEAMVDAYTAVLCSPHFFYFCETLNDAVGDQRTKLDQYAVASRLSFFLWSSAPDDELLKLASQGELRKPDVLHAQVERMLKHPKSKRFTENFAGQWLDLRKINETSPDPRIYGEFDDYLYWSMPRETQAFFNEVLKRDLPLTEFVDSDWSFLNQRLAQHYGIPGVFGGELRRVKLPGGSHRGGVLTQAAILKVTADGSKTSPVLRGAWVLDRLVGLPPDPPPPSTPAIEPDTRGTTTIRQQLDKHRNVAACASCHQHIDPPGFALESFDAIGGWRTFYRGGDKGRVELTNYPGMFVPQGPDVELGGTMPDGRTFEDIDGYRKMLVAEEDQLARNLTEKLIIYATGADIQFADREVVEQLVDESRRNNYGFRKLLHSVVQSRLFLSK